MQNPLKMTLGEWEMIVRAQNRAHGQGSSVAPPTEAEFEAAIAAARGFS